MSHVFVNFLDQDADFVINVLAKLEEKALVWTKEFDIMPGENWDQAISKAMKNADIFIFFSHGGLSILFEDAVNYAVRNATPSLVIQMNKQVMPRISFLANTKTFDWDDPELTTKLVNALPSSVQLEDSPKIIEPKQSKSKGYVFISYSIEDIAFAKKLRKFFGEKGYAYWDYQETHRKYDMPFHLEIEEAIKGAKAVASVVSPDWKRSKWATREFLFSEQLSKTNFVLIAHQVGATLLFADRTFIEFFANEEKGFETLDKALRREGLID